MRISMFKDGERGVVISELGFYSNCARSAIFSSDSFGVTSYELRFREDFCENWVCLKFYSDGQMLFPEFLCA